MSQQVSKDYGKDDSKVYSWTDRNIENKYIGKLNLVERGKFC